MKTEFIFSKTLVHLGFQAPNTSNNFFIVRLNFCPLECFNVGQLFYITTCYWTHPMDANRPQKTSCNYWPLQPFRIGALALKEGAPELQSWKHPGLLTSPAYLMDGSLKGSDLLRKVRRKVTVPGPERNWPPEEGQKEGHSSRLGFSDL